MNGICKIFAREMKIQVKKRHLKTVLKYERVFSNWVIKVHSLPKVVQGLVSGRPRVKTIRGIPIYCCCSQVESKIDFHTCDIYNCSGDLLDDILRYCSSKTTHERSVDHVFVILCPSNPKRHNLNDNASMWIWLPLIETTLCS